MTEGKISVIIPMYKVEEYIGKCIESVIKQTYTNLEIILVDDGSPDKCGEISDEYAEKDSRIKVIHRKNGGLSAARNSGLDIATGDYVMFVDSDDYIHPRMMECMYATACNKKADIVVCDYAKVKEGEATPQLQETKQVVEITKNNQLDYMLGKTKIIFTVVWNKLYRRELLQEIRFPEGKVHEDEFVTYKLLHKAKKVCYIKDVFYYYVQRTSSIMGEGINLKTLQKLDAFQERMLFYEQQGMQDYYYQMLNHYRYFLNEFVKKGYGNKKELMPYKKYYDKQIQKNVHKLNACLKTKVGFILFAVSPKFYNKMMNANE